MKINVIPAAQLSPDHWATWSRIQQTDPALANPFFRPEFTQAVAAVRDDVEVAVWEQNGEAVGFLPFERSSRHVGKPVGSLLNEFQGAIARADVSWSPQEIVRAAGLRAWHFNHLAATQDRFAPFQYVVAESPYVDLSLGFEHYRKSGTKSTATQIAETLRKQRKASRELGEVRLELNAVDRNAFKQLLAWKADQCRRTNVPSNFSRDWFLRLFERLLDHSAPEFCGMLFGLYFGDRLVAAQFDLRSEHVLHGLVRGYDPELHKFSPGSMLAVCVAQQAEELGIKRLDLGKGGEAYKSWYATGCDYVTEGAVNSGRLQTSLYAAWIQAKDRLRSTPLRSSWQRVRRWTQSTQIWLEKAR